MTAGDEARFIVQRDGERLPVTIILADPSLEEILGRLIPLLVAIVFWLVGVGTLAFSPTERTGELFFLFCQASCLLLTAGSISSFESSIASALFNSSLWLIGPLTIHFHLHFPQTNPDKRLKNLLPVLYGLAACGGLPYLISGSSAVFASSWYPVFLFGSRLFLAANLLMVVGLLFLGYRDDVVGVKSKIRIVVLGCAVSFLPVVTLTVLPDILLKQTIVPYSYAFLLLGALPITYGYAIIRHRLIEIDRHVNRGATYILVYSLLGGFYLVLYATLHNWLPFSLTNEPLVNTLLVLALAGVFMPLSRQMQKIVDRVFYGSWYDYRSAVTHITQGLEQITELPSLGETISERLVRTLRLESACVFLRDLDGHFSVISVAPRAKLGGQPQAEFPALPKNSLTYLLKIGAIEKNTLRKALAETTLTPQERRLLESEQVYLWVPIIGHGQILGLLALGSKYGGDIFSGEDMDILRIVAGHTSPLIENIHLVTRLKRHAAELEKRVTERTEELHAAKERVEAILASVGDGVVVTDLDWKVITVNTAFEEQSSYLPDEIIGRQIWDFISADEPHGQLDKIKNILQTGGAWSGELNNQRKDGNAYDVQFTMAPVRDQQQRVVGYVGSQGDFTRQKELDRLKDRLIFDVSHELRTPVTNLNLYLELMERGKSEKQPSYLLVLKGETQRLIELIESILDLSRLDIWKSKKLELVEVDLNLVAEQVYTAHRPLAESTGLELIYQPEFPLPPVRGEQNQLARLITNLLSNAIRYTPSGQILVKTFQGDGHVCLQVEDTGIGIEPEDLPNIFDRFYRGRQVSQSKISGTGLGLSIAKEIVDIHEGWIEVESELLKGSTFCVCLPTFDSSSIPL